MPATATIPQLAFAVLDAAPLEYAAAPALRFSLAVEAVEGPAVRSVLLDTQIQIAARRRGYEDDSEDRLFELFGPKESWGSTLRTLLWARVTAVVPPFEGETVLNLDVPCSYDLDVTASRYFGALEDGEVPLEFLFSGTVFYAGPGGVLQAARISWDREAAYRLPVRVWRETMDRHFAGTAWLRLRRESFDRLAAFKARNALPTWELAIDALLAGQRGEGSGWTR
jgi:hypothetical protein